jgi:hypothetical protein
MIRFDVRCKRKRPDTGVTVSSYSQEVIVAPYGVS